MYNSAFKTTAITFICMAMTPIKVKERGMINVHTCLAHTIGILAEIHITGIRKLRKI